jgi:adenylate cyclase
VAGVARPGSVLCTADAREAAGDTFRWSPAGRRRLKGVREPVRLFRARQQSNSNH